MEPAMAGSPWQRQGDYADYSGGRWQPQGHGASSSPEDAGKGNHFVHGNHYGDGEYGNGSDGRYHMQSQGDESAWSGKTYERASSQDNYRQGSSSPAAGDATSGRKRRSRWEPQPEADANEKEGSGSKKRKSRWAAEEPKNLFPNVNLPPFMTGVELDPEMQALNIKLLDLNRRLQMGQLFDERPDAPRSPSPEPIYDNMGIRINTREFRARERLTKERHELISEMIKRNPHFKPPPDYKPPKLQKKLFIPAKDFPGYNFIGLIIGPRGNTQKRMEKETGAKIVIRGKGSVKEGRTQQKRDVKPDPSENEDLHVLVEADTEEALEAAAGMVEKLLQPVEEGRNEHKRAQLRELAALNGTIRDDESCRQCGQLGHRQYCCPEKNTTFKAGVVCAKCGDGGHPTSDCTQKGPVAGNKMDGEYQKFLVEVNADGGGDATVGRQTGPSLLLGGPQGSNGAAGAHPGLGSKKEPDDTNLYVGYLPATYEDDALKRLFSSFGQIDEVKVIKDRATGTSKGYGFVKFADAGCAAQAVLHMNGWKLEEKTLAVRVAGRPPVPAGTPFGPGYPSFPRGPDGACMPPPPPWVPGPPPYNPYAPQFALAPPGTVPPPPPFNGYPGPPGPPGVPYSVAPPPPPGFSPSHGATSAQDAFQAAPGTDFSSGAPGSTFPPYPQYPGYYATPPASVPPPWTSSNDNQSNQVESEYERFMSEMKMQ